MNNIIAILKKELKRFFSDKRMLMSLLLPGLMIFIVYSLMGNFISDSMTVNKDYNYIVYVENQAKEFEALNTVNEFKIQIKDDFTETKEEVKEKIKNQEIDLYLIYDENFSSKLGSGEKPYVEMYYNSASVPSQTIYQYYSTALFSAATTIEYKFNINSDTTIDYDLATEEDISMMMVTMLLPFVLIILLYSGCMAVSTESIAGEKERGTIATLLVTPVKRSEIALGKIFALSLTSIVSSVASFIGLIASLPKLLNGAEGGITLDMYGVEVYLGVLLVIIVTVLLFTTVLSILSTFAKSIKEAGQYAIPLMVITMLAGITSMVSMGNTVSDWYLYLIPIYNSVQCLGGIFAASFNIVNFSITIVINIVYVAIGIYVLTRMFNSERIMFNK